MEDARRFVSYLTCSANSICLIFQRTSSAMWERMMFLLLLIILADTVSDILMKQFGHANGLKTDPERRVLETELAVNQQLHI